MAIELGLRQLLLGQASITSRAIAQTIGEKRFEGVFNRFPAQGFSPPYVLIHKMDHDPMKCMDGTSGLAKTEFDIDSYALAYPVALELNDAIEDFLKDYTGAAGPNDTIKAVLFNSKVDDDIALGDGRDLRLHIVSANFEIFHT